MIVIGNGIDSKSMILGSSPGGATMISYNVNDLASIKELIKYIPTDAGIYLFKNNVNGKCYVGQAINLRKRFYTHIYNYKNSKIDNLLYRAFAKYRLNNFRYMILENFTASSNIELTRKQLDMLEVEYIDKFDTYEDGYNQTEGGDGGILGYKFTKKQNEKQRENRLKVIHTTLASKIYIYDIQTGNIKMFASAAEAAKYFGWKKGGTQSCNRYLITHKHYIAARTKEELHQKIIKYNKTKVVSSKYTAKYTLDEYKKIKLEHPNASKNELCSILGICKKTLYNYEHTLGTTFSREINIKIIDTITNTSIIINNSTEGGKFFNVINSSFNRIVRTYCEKDSLYKNRYKIIRL